MADRDLLIHEFTSVTGVDEERAAFFLESAQWELHVALSSFFDNDADSPEILEEEPRPAIPQAQSAPPVSQESQPRPSRNTRPTRSNVATLGSYKVDDSSSDDEGQAFYAGGSEHSGQQIIGPGKKKMNSKKITESLFQAAKQHGAEVVDKDDEPNTSRRTQPRTFVGAGFRLGSEDDSAPAGASAQPKQRDEVKMVNFNLKFWSGGFSINDGPLRSFEDPDNRDFLASIEKGEIPDELAQNTRGAEVHVNMEDHRHEDFVTPKLSVQAFSGHGQMLGNPTPAVVTHDQPKQEDATTTQPAASPPSYHVDASQPVTTLQIRLSDGTRLVSKFNHCSTIRDVRNLVRNARPNSGTNFALMTTFPTKELVDDDQTLVDAGLLNSTIVQKQK